jgi:hypothetical protein
MEAKGFVALDAGLILDRVTFSGAIHPAEFF